MMLSSSSPVIFSLLHYSSALCPQLQTYKVTPKPQLPGDPQTSRNWHLLHAEPIPFAHLLLPADISGLKSSISHQKTFLILSLFSLPRRVSLSSALPEGWKLITSFIIIFHLNYIKVLCKECEVSICKYLPQIPVMRCDVNKWNLFSGSTSCLIYNYSKLLKEAV